MAHIIVEVCQNHSGDRKVLQEMVHAAAEAGAKYVKMQTIFSDDLTYRERFETGKGKDGKDTAIKRPYEPELTRLKSLDLEEEDHGFFVETCRDHGMLPLTTVFARGRVGLVSRYSFAGVKVASYDCASCPLLRDLRDRFEFIVVSTGATYDHEIARAASVLGNTRFAFLHCVTIYPTPLDQLHLRRMNWLRQFAPLVGFSDHTLIERDGITAAKAAFWQGADFVERHFTIQDRTKTKDGPVSMDPRQLRELVQFTKLTREDQEREVRTVVKDVDALLGRETREMTEAELRNRDYYRGRFATKLGKRVIYNWEEDDIPPVG
jgi:sialic acid synthase SpsE